MKTVENNKGFKVVEMEATEIKEYFGGLGLCDFCGKESSTGYYIAVLNCWYCPKCYEEWTKRATKYIEDDKIEKRNFKRIKPLIDMFKRLEPFNDITK